MELADLMQALQRALIQSPDFADVEVSELGEAVLVNDQHGIPWSITPEPL